MEETKPENVKCCSNCNNSKNINNFPLKKNTCKSCNNEKKRNNYNNNEELRNKKNEKRRLKYQQDEEYRKKQIKNASQFKHNKVVIRQELKLLKQEEIGFDNKKCNYCCLVKHETKFRFNRLKCRDCERDDPVDKFKRVIRSRIYLSLSKDKKTIEYLDCSSNEYLKWILTNNNDYTIENHGKEWHIDHVIPLSKFNLHDEYEQTLAFNWRNTMPLSCKENLSKNNKIIKEQIEQHLNKLIEYHKENKLDLPQIFIDLFAKYLVAGSPLEPILSNK
jgi:hypothetical protein